MSGVVRLQILDPAGVRVQGFGGRLTYASLVESILKPHPLKVVVMVFDVCSSVVLQA